jgi:predicted TIM-barrel fold metal-dependent hydrolase
MSDIPKIISVDDHVVEPAHVWQAWLPEKYKEKGPRIVRERFGKMTLIKGAKYDMPLDPEGTWGDAWVYEDEIVYVHKSHVAIPLIATPGGDKSKFDRSTMKMVPMTYDEMRPGCYDRDALIKEFEENWVDGSLPFPTMPRFCGQTFHEGADKDLGLACVQAYNDWMVEEWCGDSNGRLIPLIIVPLWDADAAAAEIRRNAARGVHAVCFSEIPPHLGLPSIHSGYWNPFFAACEETDTVVNMHIGSSSKMPSTSADAPAAVQATLSFGNAMSSMTDFLFSGVLVDFPGLKLAYSEGQMGWVPYILERADDVWEEHRAWGGVRDRIPEPPSSYYYDHIYCCFFRDRHGLKSLDEVGVDNVTFETDYPHTDSTWPHTKEVAEKMFAGLDDETIYKIVRGNAIRMLSLDVT